MADDPINLITISSPAHNSTLAEGLFSAFTAQRSVDFVLQSEAGSSISVHRIVLESFISSEKLGNIANGDTIRTGNCDLLPLLEFLYRGTVTIQRDKLGELLIAARKLDFRMLVDAVESVDVQDSEASEETVGHSTDDSKKPSIQDEDSCNNSEWDMLKSDRDSDVDSQDSDWLASHPTRTRQLIRKAAIETPSTFAANRAKITHSDAKKIAVGSKKGGSTVIGKTGNSESKTDVGLVCPECGYVCSNSNVLLYHQATHAKEKPFTCRHCPFASSIKGSLLRHSIIVHGLKPDEDEAVETAPEIFHCPHCAYSGTKLRYNRHMYSVHYLRTNGQQLDKDFPCPLCPFRCVNGSTLRNHTLTKHAVEKTAKCPLCPYAASRVGTINQHVRRVHRGEDRNYMCETCSLRLASLAHLERHRRTHTGERPFVCDTCGRSFAHKGSLRDHAALHASDAKPFVCHVCARGFNRKSNLKVHLGNVHKNVEPYSDH